MARAGGGEVWQREGSTRRPQRSLGVKCWLGDLKSRSSRRLSFLGCEMGGEGRKGQDLPPHSAVTRSKRDPEEPARAAEHSCPGCA